MQGTQLAGYTTLMGRPSIDISGLTFGTLAVVSKAEKSGPSGDTLWNLTCTVCGGENLRTASALRRGRATCLAECRAEIARNSPIRGLYGGYKRNAQKAGRDFTLTFEFFRETIQKKCFYCGIPSSSVWRKPGARRTLEYNGLDRIDSAIGYVPSNVVPCCKYCNFAKSRWEREEFVAWLAHVRSTG